MVQDGVQSVTTCLGKFMMDGVDVFKIGGIELESLDYRFPVPYLKGHGSRVDFVLEETEDQ